MVRTEKHRLYNYQNAQSPFLVIYQPRNNSFRNQTEFSTTQLSFLKNWIFYASCIWHRLHQACPLPNQGIPTPPSKSLRGVGHFPVPGTKGVHILDIQPRSSKQNSVGLLPHRTQGGHLPKTEPSLIFSTLAPPWSTQIIVKGSESRSAISNSLQPHGLTQSMKFSRPKYWSG